MLALGDSWFDYPLDGNSLTIGATDIIAQLQTMGGNPPVIYNISHYGDATTDEMALPKQERTIQALQDPTTGSAAESRMPFFSPAAATTSRATSFAFFWIMPPLASTASTETGSRKHWAWSRRRISISSF